MIIAHNWTCPESERAGFVTLGRAVLAILLDAGIWADVTLADATQPNHTMLHFRIARLGDAMNYGWNIPNRRQDGDSVSAAVDMTRSIIAHEREAFETFRTETRGEMVTAPSPIIWPEDAARVLRGRGR